jgi:hypothetical protein
VFIFRQSNRTVITILTLTLIPLACAIPGLGSDQPTVDAGGPQVTISSPSAGDNLEPNREVTVQSISVDSAGGVVRVELSVDGQVIWVDANPDPQPDVPYIVSQPWTPTTPGSHMIQVRAFNVANVAGQSEPLSVGVVADVQAIDDQLSTATSEPETKAPTNTSVAIISDASTATATVSPTETPASPTPAPSPTITLTPTATPTPGIFAATGLEPEDRFGEIWLELGAGKSRLGYPTGVEIIDRDFAKQYFEKGMMYWWDNPDGSDYIWVIDSPEPDMSAGTTSNRFVEDWDGGDEYSCKAALANAEKGPIRGFGKLWCARPELRDRLGNPQEREAGSGGNPPYGHVQFFQGGVMLYNPLNSEVFVLYDQGDWRRFQY